ncbi:MAG: fliG [Actinomycetia bacterium]|jgi:flagellar motor switch protein FliG|nr:fliG [Actinomycetes bacterium]
MSGLRKAAVLLVQMGRDDSARVLAQMREAEVEELTTEIVRLGQIEAVVAADVISEFHELALAYRHVSQGGFDYARELLVASLGFDRAEDLIGRLSVHVRDVPFSFLLRADARQVLSFVQDEHPQTIALVLAHVPAHQASLILSGLSPELQSDVANRIAIMDRTSPEIVRRVEDTLERKLTAVLQPGDLSTVGGLQPLVDILNRADRATEKLILEGLAIRNAELADEVRARMFTFDDMASLDDKSVQLVLRQVETGDLALALKGVTEGVKEKIMGNLSSRAAENLRDEIDMMGAVRIRQVEESQAKILTVVRSLEESGELVIRRGGDDEFVS